MPENKPYFSRVTVSDVNEFSRVAVESEDDLSSILGWIRSLPKAKQEEFHRLFPEIRGAEALLKSGIAAVSNFDPVEYKPFGEIKSAQL